MNSNELEFWKTANLNVPLKRKISQLYLSYNNHFFNANSFTDNSQNSMRYTTGPLEPQCCILSPRAASSEARSGVFAGVNLFDLWC